jgi:hypothetical protein
MELRYIKDLISFLHVNGIVACGVKAINLILMNITKC